MTKEEYRVLIGQSPSMRRLRLREFIAQEKVSITKYRDETTHNLVILVRVTIGGKQYSAIQMISPFDYLDMSIKEVETEELKEVEKLYNIHKWLTVGEP